MTTMKLDGASGSLELADALFFVLLPILRRDAGAALLRMFAHAIRGCGMPATGWDHLYHHCRSWRAYKY
jgi:hypothetical protein